MRWVITRLQRLLEALDSGGGAARGTNSAMLRHGWIGVVVLSLGLASTAQATPRGTYIRVDETQAHVLPSDQPVPLPEAHGSHILYLNPCIGGETFSPGYNDSRTNRSSIINGTRTLPQYPYGDASFNQVVQCVREIMGPFNITVVTEDPGNTPHHEAVVCGHPNDIGMQDGVGGVAPFSCGVIENAITYTFPEIYGGWTRGICETIAQEAAHGWGLDHEYLCADPMTYLNGCGDKFYQDNNAPCGEYSARSCSCGGSTQNSYQRIKAIFGASTPTPPVVAITEPVNNANVEPGFIVRADFDDNDGVKNAALYVDDQLAMMLDTPPFVFNAPSSMSDGSHEIKVVAHDLFDAEGSDSIYVIVGEPCGGSDDCDSGQACVDGRCVPGPGTPGGLGETCTNGDECASGLCGTDADGDQLCTEPCDPAADACPGGFECRSAGEGGVCWPGTGGGGGCDVGRSDRLPPGFLALLGLVALALLARRRT